MRGLLRRKTWIMAVLLLGPLPALLYSCQKCDVNGSDTCRYITSIALHAYDNSDSLSREINTGVRGKALKLELSVMDSTVLCFHPAKTSAFLPAAYARYCKEYMTRDMDALSEFTLVSDADFDATHPAGSDLIPLFYSNSSKSLATGLHTYYLRSAPASAAVHRLTITCRFTSGKILTDTLPAIQLLP